ncbi:MAG: AMP-dependent synthetase, partial [Bryobacteraceae bacterium]|nr:AMP-dependent synthetase [Bryobacteraceae bacterium]
PSVIEAAVIGVPHEIKGECMIAFCVLRPDSEVTQDLARELRDRVAAELGKPLRPEEVHFVSSFPKTRNAKIMRRVIRAVWLGENPGDVSALENPESLDAIRAARKST